MRSFYRTNTRVILNRLYRSANSSLAPFEMLDMFCCGENAC